MADSELLARLMFATFAATIDDQNALDDQIDPLSHFWLGAKRRVEVNVLGLLKAHEALLVFLEFNSRHTCCPAKEKTLLLFSVAVQE